MAMAGASHSDDIYRTKIRQFIQLSIKISEQGSGDEESSNSPWISSPSLSLAENGSASPDLSRSYDSISHSSDLGCNGSISTGINNNNSEATASEEVSFSDPNTPIERLNSGLSSKSHHHHNRIHSRSIISDLFTGELANTIRCTSCNHVSVQIETFQDLSIPISIIDRAIQTRSSFTSNPKCTTTSFNNNNNSNNNNLSSTGKFLLN